MLAADTARSAAGATALLRDGRVTQFYDPAGLAGRALARAVGWPGEVAWDIYLFYRVGSVWGEQPAAPVAWMHQLREHADDLAHFRRGPALTAQLQVTMQRFVGPR